MRSFIKQARELESPVTWWSYQDGLPSQGTFQQRHGEVNLSIIHIPGRREFQDKGTTRAKAEREARA